jgi:hypothetical protein
MSEVFGCDLLTTSAQSLAVASSSASMWMLICQKLPVADAGTQAESKSADDIRGFAADAFSSWNVVASAEEASTHTSREPQAADGHCVADVVLLTGVTGFVGIFLLAEHVVPTSHPTSESPQF